MSLAANHTEIYNINIIQTEHNTHKYTNQKWVITAASVDF